MKNTFWSKFAYSLIGATIASLIFIALFYNLLKYRALDKAIGEISKSEYSAENYNCVNFSKDAVTKLNSKNIDANTIVIQKPGSATTHAVVSVWIDPQTGLFINDASYVGDYSELKNKFGWVR